MASKTRRFPANREQSLRDSSSNGGSGHDDHAPIGLWSGDVFRDLIRFDLDWTGVHRIKRAILRLRRSNQTHVARGATPRVLIRRVTATWQEDGGSENSWATSASTVYPGPSTTGTGEVDSGLLGDSNDNDDTIDITDIVDAWAPSDVLKSGGSAGSGASNYGIRIVSFDEGTNDRTTEFFSRRSTESRRPVIELTYSDNHPPSFTVTSPEESTTSPILVPSASGTEFTVEYGYTDIDGDAHAGVRLEVWTDATVDATATQANIANMIGTTNEVAPVSAGSAGNYRITAYSVPARTIMKVRLSVMDARGDWSGYNSLFRVQTAYIPGIPLNPEMETKPDRPHIRGTLNGVGTISGVEIEVVRDTSTGTITLWAPGMQDVGGSSTRTDEEYAGSTLGVGDVIRWRQRHRNDDDVTGTWSQWYTNTIVAEQGSTVDVDLDTKLTSRTQAIDIAFPSSSDGYQWRIYRTSEGAVSGSGTLIYDSGVVAISAASSASPTIPTGVANWGDYLEIDAAARPVATGVLGVFGALAQTYVNSLPNISSISASDGEGHTGTVLPTLDPLWYAPYDDRDVARYAEVPSAKEVEYRVGATPQGSGALMERRDNLAAYGITDYEATGRQLDALDATTGWSAGASATLSAAAVNPTDYTGTSLKIAVAALASGNSSTTPKAIGDDLTVFGGQTFFGLYCRASSLTNLSGIYIGFGGAAWGASWNITPSMVNTWEPFSPIKSGPANVAGTIDWSTLTYMQISVGATGGAYTGDVYVRDLRMGSVQPDTTPPTGSPAAEATMDARIRYRDDADAKVTATLAASSIATATNIKYNAPGSGTFEVGDDITIETPHVIETRRITAVGTAGGGGTGLTLSEALAHAHGNGDTAKVYYWGAWTSWLTKKLSYPPVVAATAPSNGATITDATPDHVFTYTSPGGKAKASHTLRIYSRVDGVDTLVYERETEGTGLTETGPPLLLDDGLTYAWDITAYDTDGLETTTTRFTYITDFTRPDAVTNLTATPDEDSSAVVIAWTAVAGADHYRVYRRDTHGQDVRIDEGPVEVGDGRTALTAVFLTYYGGRLGEDLWTVSAHSGAVDGEGATSTVQATLTNNYPGRWVMAHETNDRYTLELRVTGAPRTHGAIIERYTPPGRGSTIHRKWGRSGQAFSLTVLLRPTVDGDVSTILQELQERMEPVWLKPPSGWVMDPAWVVVTGVTDTPGVGGMLSIQVDVEETERET